MAAKHTAPAFSIRPATANDAPALLMLIQKLGEYERRPVAVKSTEAKLRRWLFGCNVAQALLAEADGKPVGYAIFHPVFHSFRGVPTLYLEDVFVLAEARGTGLGMALMRQVALHAAQGEYEGLEWNCLAWNEPAIQFYHHLGAKQKPDSVSFTLEGDALRALTES